MVARVAFSFVRRPMVTRSPAPVAVSAIASTL
jgi:hypothetical protein